MVDELSNKKIIVTGGEGFIGDYLIEKLRQKNTVISLDNGLNGHSRPKRPNVKYYRADADQVSDFLAVSKVDMIYHLGEYSRVEASFDRLDLVVENNFQQFAEVCKAAAKYKTKLIYSASSTLFTIGGANFTPSPYQLFKHLNVSFLNEYGSLKGLDYAITYFYNAYGPGEVSKGEFATVVAKFLDRARKGLPLQITLPGTQRRNFTHIDDIANGLIAVGLNGQGDGYGIGSGESYSIIELADLISENVEYTPEKGGNRHDAVLNIEQTRKLGWCAKKVLKDYIKQELKK